MKDENRILELSVEKANLEKALHVIWSSPEPINDAQRQHIEGMKAHLHGINKELQSLEAV